MFTMSVSVLGTYIVGTVFLLYIYIMHGGGVNLTHALYFAMRVEFHLLIFCLRIYRRMGKTSLLNSPVL